MALTKEQRHVRKTLLDQESRLRGKRLVESVLRAELATIGYVRVLHLTGSMVRRMADAYLCHAGQANVWYQATKGKPPFQPPIVLCKCREMPEWIETHYTVKRQRPKSA